MNKTRSEGRNAFNVENSAVPLMPGRNPSSDPVNRMVTSKLVVSSCVPTALILAELALNLR